MVADTISVHHSSLLCAVTFCALRGGYSTCSVCGSSRGPGPCGSSTHVSPTCRHWAAITCSSFPFLIEESINSDKAPVLYVFHGWRRRAPCCAPQQPSESSRSKHPSCTSAGLGAARHGAPGGPPAQVGTTLHHRHAVLGSFTGTATADRRRKAPAVLECDPHATLLACRSLLAPGVQAMTERLAAAGAQWVGGLVDGHAGAGVATDAITPHPQGQGLARCAA